MTNLEGTRPLLDETPAVAGDAPGSITARRHVPAEEPFFAGHFPAMPVVPGVFMVEALAECARSALPPGAMLASVRLVRFRRPVRPGETLDLRVTSVETDDERGCFDAVASVEGRAAVQATLEFRMEGETPEP